MGYFKRNSTNRGARRTGAKRPAGKKAAVKKALKQNWNRKVAEVVKKVLSSRLENKHQVKEFSLSPQCLMPTTSSITGNYFIVSPSNSSQGYSISNGTANNEMVGNRINVKKLCVTGVLTPSPYNGTTNVTPRPQFVRIYFFRNKRNPIDDPTTVELTSPTTADFFENGGSSVGFIGRLLDMVKKVNNETFTYLTHRTYKIGLKDGYNSANATQGNMAYSNNDFKYATTFKIDLSKYIKKAHKDDDGTWTSSWITMLVQPVAADDSAYLANISLPCQMDAQVDITYTDA